MGLMDRGGVYAKFENDGDRVEGVVVEVDEYPAVYDGQPKLSKAGKQLKAYRIPLTQANGEELIIDTFQWRMIKAIQDAVVAAGMSDLLPGSTLAVWRTGSEKGGGTIPATTYAAQVTPRTSGLAAPGPLLERSVAAAVDSPARPEHVQQAVWNLLSPAQQKAIIAETPPPF